MSVVFSRPYQFVPPVRSNFWPAFVQRLRLVDRFIRKKDGVVSHKCSGLEHLRDSLSRGDGIVLAPNHSRYNDPMVMGLPARESGTHVFAMASWHLFNEKWFEGWAIRRMGGFSIHREGTDRKSLETAIKIVTEAQRPLVLFPEGTTSRTNDHVMPLLDGVTFIARTAARKRAKKSDGRVVIHPVAIKYLCVGDVTPWASAQLENLEKQIGWYPKSNKPIRERTVGVVEALLSLKEIEYTGHTNTGGLVHRRDALIEHVLSTTEHRLSINNDTSQATPRTRARQIRTEISRRYFSTSPSEAEKAALMRDAVAADLAQELTTYLEEYLLPETVTDTRIVETIQRMQESFLGKIDASIPLHAEIQVDEPIEVPAAKAPKGQSDPVLEQVSERLHTMIGQLAKSAKSLKI